MQNLTEKEKMLVKYGLALVLEEITSKAQTARSKGNNISVLSGYKKQLKEVAKLIDKF
jgi:hypothetical protein